MLHIQLNTEDVSIADWPCSIHHVQSWIRGLCQRDFKMPLNIGLLPVLT